MARLRCEVLERDGLLPAVVRDESGRVLRLSVDAPPPGAQWLGHIGGLGVWGTPVDTTRATEPLEVVWLDTPALDEVGVVVGPERGDALGLFDSPNSVDTGEHTEGASSGPGRVGEQRRTSVLAWIAAQEAHAPPTHGRHPKTEAARQLQGAPCEALKRLVADEPLDPLPALEGVPRFRPAVELRRTVELTQDNPVAQADEEQKPDVSEPRPVLARLTLLVSVAVAVAMVAWAFGWTT